MISNIDNLPLLVQCKIFEYLDYEGNSKIAAANKKLNSNVEKYFKILCTNKGIENVTPETKTYKKLYEEKTKIKLLESVQKGQIQHRILSQSGEHNCPNSQFLAHDNFLIIGEQQRFDRPTRRQELVKFDFKTNNKLVLWEGKINGDKICKEVGDEEDEYVIYDPETLERISEERVSASKLDQYNDDHVVYFGNGVCSILNGGCGLIDKNKILTIKYKERNQKDEISFNFPGTTRLIGGSDSKIALFTEDFNIEVLEIGKNQSTPILTLTENMNFHAAFCEIDSFVFWEVPFRHAEPNQFHKIKLNSETKLNERGEKVMHREVISWQCNENCDVLTGLGEHVLTAHKGKLLIWSPEVQTPICELSIKGRNVSSITVTNDRIILYSSTSENENYSSFIEVFEMTGKKKK